MQTEFVSYLKNGLAGIAVAVVAVALFLTVMRGFSTTT